VADRTSSGFDDLKLVVFNAQLLDNDFERIEREFGIDLGRSALGSDDRDDDYYPQFDEDLRREAAEMAAHYEVFYCLEKSIRRLISQTLEVAEKVTWWESGRIPAAVVTDVAKRMQREVDSAVTVRSSEPLDFTTFGELGEIIKSNWDLFGSIFDSQRAVEKVMANLNTLRGPIAHCSPLAADEVLRLQLAMRDWFRLMS
jgi:hypothetical protein